ncbi:hypothetical protein KCU78_g8118, partial [Aureobasidium melanogenum]
HSQLKTGHPVRSAIHKQLNGRLVLRWVTTWESLLLYVLHQLFASLSTPCGHALIRLQPLKGDSFDVKAQLNHNAVLEIVCHHD